MLPRRPSRSKVGGTNWALQLSLLPPTPCAAGLESQSCPHEMMGGKRGLVLVWCFGSVPSP